MSEMICAIEFEQTASPQALAFARLGARPAARRCPNCHSIIYSRRHKLCGVCASELPESCLFSEIQARAVEEILREERERHRAWLHRANYQN